MEGLVFHTPMLDRVRNRGFFDREPFVLIDVGCSGGIDPHWRHFGPSLVAHGYDPNVAACEEAQAAEPFSRVKYHPRFVGLPESHPIHQRRIAEHKCWPNPNPWDRISAGHMARKQREAPAGKPGSNGRWADPSTAIGVDGIVAEERLATVDFLKVDVDGPDLDVLETAKGVLAAKQVLAVGLEVNWYGSASRIEHTFHNTDLLLREQSYSLFAVSFRPYSRTALPAPFAAQCYAQTIFGQPYQGDAVYVRDLAAPHEKANAAAYPAEKLLKLACIYELIGLPDCAAEAILSFRDRFTAFGDTEELLDALTPPLLGEKLTYRQYIHKFETEPELFLPSAQHAWERRQATARKLAEQAQWLREMIAARGGLLKRFARKIKRVMSRAAGILGPG